MCDESDPGEYCLDLAFEAATEVDLLPGSDYSCEDLTAGCTDDPDSPLTVDDCKHTLRGFNAQAREDIVYCYACGDPIELDGTLSCGSLFLECVFPNLADATESYPYLGDCTENAGGAGGAAGAGGASG
jgi:hypothetical protein